MSRRLVRIAAALAALAFLGAGCTSSDKSGSDTNPTTPKGGTTSPSSDPTKLVVDRSSRFAKADSFCEPATSEDTATPEATDDGITANSISITHIRVTLEDLAGIGFAIPIGDPADQVKRFV